MRQIAPLLALLLLLPATAGAQPLGEPALWAALGSPGHVALMRHATAPGNADPANFTIGDCSTQRNLSEDGRAQARRVGDSFRSNGLSMARVFSSQWCRCQDTAEQLGLGKVELLPALNSLHGRSHLGDAQAAALRDFLKAKPMEGPPLVLVTHHATIARFTGVGTASGAIVVARRNDEGGLDLLGTLPAR